MAMTGAPTSAIADLAACSGDRPSVSSRCCTASTTTIASSTTIPIARTSPNSVNVLIEKPSAVNAANVPTSEIGTTRIGINVARQLCRNRNTTSTTRAKASTSVVTTSFSDSVTNGVVLYGIEYCRPAGKRSAC